MRGLVLARLHSCVFFCRGPRTPLEAQGRGFAHGHEKIISVPRTRAARLKGLFQKAGAAERPEDEHVAIKVDKKKREWGVPSKGADCLKIVNEQLRQVPPQAVL